MKSNKKFRLDMEACFPTDDPFFHPALSNMTATLRHINTMVGANEIAIRRKEVVVWFEYPFDDRYEVSIRSRSAKGFTKIALVKAIIKKYRELYRKLDKNHKVWGHHWRDLALEGIIERKSGVLELEVGS